MQSHRLVQAQAIGIGDVNVATVRILQTAVAAIVVIDHDLPHAATGTGANATGATVARNLLDATAIEATATWIGTGTGATATGATATTVTIAIEAIEATEAIEVTEAIEATGILGRAGVIEVTD